MAFQIVYWVFIIFAMGISWRLGGREARLFVLAIMLASLITMFANEVQGMEGSIGTVLAIDAVLLLFAVVRALRTEVFWPIWFAAFLAASIVSGLGAFLFPSAANDIYQNIAGFWAIPALLVMLFGILSDYRSQLVPAKGDLRASRLR